jgi:hypothetical protein
MIRLTVLIPSTFSKALLIFLFVLCVPLLPTESTAEWDYRIDIAHGGRWYDAEKSSGNTNDDWLCWASTAANVLAWTGWGDAAGFSDEDQILAYYSEHWTDHPSGSPREAWRWWFSGVNRDKDGANVIQDGGAFFPEVVFPWNKWGHRFGSLFLGVGQNQLQRHPEGLQDMLEAGYGVVLQITRPLAGESRDSHMITLWGIRYHEDNRVLGILVTDSDDAKSIEVPEKAEDMLVYYPIELRDRFWRLHYRGHDWKILAAYGLLHKALYR